MLEILSKRRTVRKFDPKHMVEKEKIEEIVQAGLHAPSGKNLQAGEIFVITNPDFRKELVRFNAEIGQFPSGFDPFYGAPVILLVAAKDCPYTDLDGAAMIENMLLEATNQGLSTCWIHRAKAEFEMEGVKELFASYGIDISGYVGVDHIALGYGLGEQPKPKAIRPGRVHYIE